MLKLVHSNTIGIQPILNENILGQSESSHLTGHGTVCLIPDNQDNKLKVGDSVFYNALAGSHLPALNIVVCNLDSVMILDEKEIQE